MSQASEHLASCEKRQDVESYIDAVQDAFKSAVMKNYKKGLLKSLVFSDESKLGISFHQNGQINKFFMLSDE